MADTITRLFNPSGQSESFAGQTIVGTQGAASAIEAENTRQKRIAAMQNSLAQLSTGELANLDTSTPDKRVAENLLARRDTILTQRLQPGRTQTILANINNRAI